MKKTIILSLAVVILGSFLSGFALSRSSKTVNMRMHIKDVPQHNLRLIGPSDPSFDERLRKELKGEANEVVETLKPFSVFLENRGPKAVVAYLIQWCFTKPDGSNQYYRKGVVNPQALMDGENLSPELRQQSGWVEPDSARFLSLLAPDGGGMLRAEVSPKEVEEFRQGKKFDQTWLLERFGAQAAKFTEITVSIDGAFFEDGTFVGPDTTRFFDQTQAVINAKRDFLKELAEGLSNSARNRDQLYERIRETATQPIESIDSSSTPADYYNYFKKLAATEFLRTKDIQGEDKAIGVALRPVNKPWATLRKKD
jgi:hypothetical protein